MAALKAAPAEFYERKLDDRRNSQWLPVEGNPYERLWRATAALVPAGLDVIELGCGTGRLASLLIPKSRSYLGLDFAPRLVGEARKFVPGGQFNVLDLRTGPIPVAPVYVANEVMEHLEDDLGLLRRLVSGSFIVFSVPSFDSASHVRYFPRRGEALARYSGLVTHGTIVYVPHGRRGRFFHLIAGRIA